MIEPSQQIILQVEGLGPYSVAWTVPATLAYLDGHFPGQPILPAVAIIDASLVAISQIKGQEQELRSVVTSKFLSPVTPGMRVDISLHEAEPGAWKIEWKEAGSPRVLSQLLLLV